VRSAFAGTAPFAELVLSLLLESRHAPQALVTNPDRPRGRHGTPQAPPIASVARASGLAVLQPPRISAPDAVRDLLATGAEVLVVCAYGQIVTEDLLDAMPTIVVHPSAVPRWRGPAPVERALMAGETELGVATLRMTAGVDEGPVGDMRRVHVPRDADAGRAYELLATPAADGVLAVLDAMATGTVAWRAQEGEPTYAAKIGAADRQVDWRRPATAIADQVRALSPHIGAVTELLGRRTLLWRVAAGTGPLPERGAGRLALPAADGWVEVLELQQEGRSRLTAAEFLRGAGRALAAP
jgi:methionyl-tRNA formyltransferase